MTWVRLKAFLGVIATNTVIALAAGCALLFWLSPRLLERQVEAQPGFPRGVVVLSPSGLSIAAPAPDRSGFTLLARAKREGRLGFVTATIERAGEAPSVGISCNLVRLGVLTGLDGECQAQAGRALALKGGAFRVGQRLPGLPGGVVSGVVNPSWLPLGMSDFTGLSDLTTLVPLRFEDLSGGDYPTVFLRPVAAGEPERAVKALGTLLGLPYGWQSMSNYANAELNGMEVGQSRPRAFMAAILLALCLAAVSALIVRSWYSRRGDLRIMRMLGRSRSFMARQWLLESLNSWGWGLLLAGLGAAGFAVMLGSSDLLPAILAGLGGVAACGLAVTVILGRLALGFALGAGSQERRASPLRLAPLALTAAVVVAMVPLAATNSLRLFSGTGGALASLGEFSAVAQPLGRAAARRLFGCGGMSQVVCVQFRFVNVDPWPEQPGRTPSNLQLVAGISESDARTLGFVLTAGRWPRPGRSELMANESKLTVLKSAGRSAGVGVKVMHGEVVGVVRPPAHEGFQLSGRLQFLDAPLFVAYPPSALLPAEVSAPPTGETGLFLSAPTAEALVAAKLVLRSAGDAVEFIEVSSYSRVLHEVARRSVAILGAELALAVCSGAFLVGLVIAGTLERQRFALGVERALGLSVLAIVRRLLRREVTVVAVAGTLSALVCALVAPLTSLVGPEFNILEGTLQGLGVCALLTILAGGTALRQARQIGFGTP